MRVMVGEGTAGFQRYCAAWKRLVARTARPAPDMPCWRGRPPCTLEPLARLEQWARGGAAGELARAVDARKKAWRGATQASARTDWAATA
eukprot:9917797-Alexandrium_andersonii.AAC.1